MPSSSTTSPNGRASPSCRRSPTTPPDGLGAPVLFAGIPVPCDGRHSPNEKAELDRLLKSAETSACLWGDLAENRLHAPGPTGAVRSGTASGAHWKGRPAPPPPGPVSSRPSSR